MDLKRHAALGTTLANQIEKNRSAGIEMLNTPNQVTSSVDVNAREGASLTVLSTAFLHLRERSRALLRDRSEELRAIESRLQEQLAKLVAEANHIQPSPPAAPAPLAPPPAHTDAIQGRIEVLEAEVRHLQQLRQDSEAALDEARVLLAEMEDERRTLRERLDADEQRQVAAPTHHDGEEVDRLQRRLKLAIQEIRELKDQNAELTARLEQPVAASREAVVATKSFDWETQKQQFLQQLETDFDPTQANRAAEKLRIEDVIRNTDRVIAEKDRELEELRQLISDQPAFAAAHAANAAEREQVLDTSELVSAERQRLNQLQEEWREKLRKSEVEISIERAKLARERLQLDEKMRVLQPTGRSGNEAEKKSDDPKAGAVPRGRWLTRLGLGNND